jgi:hypothetical protein
MEYVVQPTKDDAWEFALRDENGEKVAGAGGHATRTAAIDAAREHRGDRRTYYEGGEPAGWVRGGPERVVLLRRDGSTVGEVDHALNDLSGPAQQADIEPAGETSAAGLEE